MRMYFLRDDHLDLPNGAKISSRILQLVNRLRASSSILLEIGGSSQTYARAYEKKEPLNYSTLCVQQHNVKKIHL